MDDLVGLVEQRLHMARRDGREGEARMLAREHERWVMLKKGAMLPGFGFAVIEADTAQLTLKFVDTDLSELYEFTLNR